MSQGRRVVVTGVGLRSPIGNSMDELSASLQQGRSGVRAVPAFGAVDHLRTGVAGLVEELGDERSIPRKSRRSMGRVGLLAALAAQEAVRAAGLDDELLASERCGVAFGSTTGSSAAQQLFLEPILAGNSLQGLQSSSYLQFMAHTCAANLAVMFRAKGPLVASCTACTSGSQGVGFGYQQVRWGLADVMLTGGAEEMHFLVAGIFDIMHATSTRYNASPELTPRPFDRDRDGLVVAEGAACLVLEEREHALRRGAPVLAEVLGYGTNCNGDHMTNGDPDGIAACMRLALRDAELPAEAIEHINAHATGTDIGDAAEALATHKVFGTRVPVSALKGYMGHTLGASGAIESVATLAMLREGFAAASKNLEVPDPELPPLDHVLGAARALPMKIAMNNNFAFGGVNTSLIFGRP